MMETLHKHNNSFSTMKKATNFTIKHRNRKYQAVQTDPGQVCPAAVTIDYSEYINYLTQHGNGDGGIGNGSKAEAGEGKCLDNQVYRLLRRINMGKNMNRSMKDQYKEVTFHNQFLAQNINPLALNSIHSSQPNKRTNTWMEAVHRKSQIYSINSRKGKRSKNRSVPDWNLSKALIATQCPIRQEKRSESVDGLGRRAAARKRACVSIVRH